MDTSVLLFTLTVAVVTGLLFGVAPAAQTTNPSLVSALKEGGHGTTAGSPGRRVRGVLVVAEIALAFVLLVASGLLMRSFFKLLDIDPGFDATNVLTAGLPINQEQHPDPVELNAYLASISAAVEAVPGVRETAMTSALPLQGWGYGVPYSIADRELMDRANRRPAFFKIVSPSYFDALGIKLLAGRVLSDNDMAGAPPVALINETLAKREFPDENPIGRRILVREIVPGKTEFGQEIAWEIVGVIAGEKITGLGDEISAGMYVSNQQSPTYGINLIVRAGMPPQSLQKAVRSAVDSVNRDQALSDVRTLEQIVDQSMLANRVTSTLLTAFASIALLLAAVGIYGVISYTAAQRTHEMGIRAALGASAGNLRRLIFQGGMRLDVDRTLDRTRRNVCRDSRHVVDALRRRHRRPADNRCCGRRALRGSRAGVFLASLADHESRSNGSAAVSMREWLAPIEHEGQPRDLIYDSRSYRCSSSALAESECAWGALRKPVILPGVRRGLNLRHGLSLGPRRSHSARWRRRPSSRDPERRSRSCCSGVPGGPFTSPANAPPAASTTTAVATTSSRLISQPPSFFDQPKTIRLVIRNIRAVSRYIVVGTMPDVAEARSVGKRRAKC